MAQNLMYFVQREQQPKQPTMPAEVAQLVTALSRVPTQQTLPPQQVLLPTEQQQQGTAPLHPTDEPPRAKGMETDTQEKEVGQGDEKMDDGARAHGSGSKELMGDAEQT